MFPHDYFACDYFGGDYWPPECETVRGRRHRGSYGYAYLKDILRRRNEQRDIDDLIVWLYLQGEI